MRDGMTPQLLDAIGAVEITTGILVRLDFSTGPVFVWNGPYPLQPVNTGDSLLEGNVFEPLAEGVLCQIGANSFSLEGSGELTLAIAVPVNPTAAIAASQVYPAEYQSRPATLWRAVKLPNPDPLAEPIWLCRHIRSGAMDKVEIQDDGRSHIFKLTIESHASLISAVSNQNYDDQKRYDPADTSQDFAAASANGDFAPSKGSNAANSTGIPSYKQSDFYDYQRFDD